MQGPQKVFLLMKGTFIEGKLAIAFGSYQDYSRYSSLKLLKISSRKKNQPEIVT